MVKTINVGLAHGAFKGSFKAIFPECRIIQGSDDVENFDLVIFTGGADINPALYGQENLYSSYSEVRDGIEVPILKKALELNKKIFGVCRGHQLINAVLGGLLIQDIYNQLGFSHGGSHKINWTGEPSDIYPFFENGVNSIHHQGVIEVGEGLTPTSEYGGVIESTEGDKILSVQWHPEFMYPTFGSRGFFDWMSTEWLQK